MNFFIFFVFYIFSTLILALIGFVLYKLWFKKLISTKLAENTLLAAFDSLDQKSILDIDTTHNEEEKKDEKIYTYF